MGVYYDFSSATEAGGSSTGIGKPRSTMASGQELIKLPTKKKGSSQGGGSSDFAEVLLDNTAKTGHRITRTDSGRNPVILHFNAGRKNFYEAFAVLHEEREEADAGGESGAEGSEKGLERGGLGEEKEGGADKGAEGEKIDTFQHHPQIQNLILCSNNNINMGLKCVYLQN